jgi:D-alanyl-D-alanine carboxypeptidase
MTKAGVVALLVLALMGCSGGDRATEPTPSAPVTAVSFPDPATAPLDPAKAKGLQDVLAKIVAMPDGPAGSRGATAAVVTDRWTWSGAAGSDARGTALTPATSMAAAKIVQPFVAAEVMLLAKAGKIELDKPISTYVKHKLALNNATVRQHLSMTSGVQDYLPDDYAQMDKAAAEAPSKHWTLEQALAFATAPVGPPNSPRSYSYPSYTLLGLLIEKVTGQPLATVLRSDLATPAGLPHAAFQDGERPQPPVVVDANYDCGRVNDGYLPCRAFASLLAAVDGLAADAPTVARWGYQLYGGRVLPADVVAEMTKGDGDFGLGTMLFPEQFEIGAAYGYGGYTPDHSSLLVVIPAKKVAVSLLLADGQRKLDTAMAELLTAIQPLLN